MRFVKFITFLLSLMDPLTADRCYEVDGYVLGQTLKKSTAETVQD